ncbi:uncharacterized protein VNE69_08068 [Vairimorpha necatrix]|uniref:Uncharacterized protein n=1 Tax=Vairimorpha necatrix TaxID=6039 RepID=A0AAX4JEV7_9MICR
MTKKETEEKTSSSRKNTKTKRQLNDSMSEFDLNVGSNHFVANWFQQISGDLRAIRKLLMEQNNQNRSKTKKILKEEPKDVYELSRISEEIIETINPRKKVKKNKDNMTDKIKENEKSKVKENEKSKVKENEKSKVKESKVKENVSDKIKTSSQEKIKIKDSLKESNVKDSSKEKSNVKDSLKESNVKASEENKIKTALQEKSKIKDSEKSKIKDSLKEVKTKIDEENKMKKSITQNIKLNSSLEEKLKAGDFKYKNKINKENLEESDKSQNTIEDSSQDIRYLTYPNEEYNDDFWIGKLKDKVGIGNPFTVSDIRRIYLCKPLKKFHVKMWSNLLNNLVLRNKIKIVDTSGGKTHYQLI